MAMPLLLLALAATQDPQVPDRPALIPAVSIDAADHEMNKAISKAQHRWPEFANAFADKDGDRFFVQAALTENDNNEHLWLRVDSVEGDTVRGILINEPTKLRSAARGDERAVRVRQVSDWVIDKGGNRRGGFSIPLLKRRADAANDPQTVFVCGDALPLAQSAVRAPKFRKLMSALPPQVTDGIDINALAGLLPLARDFIPRKIEGRLSQSATTTLGAAYRGALALMVCDRVLDASDGPHVETARRLAAEFCNAVGSIEPLSASFRVQARSTRVADQWFEAALDFVTESDQPWLRGKIDGETLRFEVHPARVGFLMSSLENSLERAGVANSTRRATGAQLRDWSVAAELALDDDTLVLRLDHGPTERVTPRAEFVGNARAPFAYARSNHLGWTQQLSRLAKVIDSVQGALESLPEKDRNVERLRLSLYEFAHAPESFEGLAWADESGIGWRAWRGLTFFDDEYTDAPFLTKPIPPDALGYFTDGELTLDEVLLGMLLAVPTQLRAPQGISWSRTVLPTLSEYMESQESAVFLRGWSIIIGKSGPVDSLQWPQQPSTITIKAGGRPIPALALVGLPTSASQGIEFARSCAIRLARDLAKQPADFELQIDTSTVDPDLTIHSVPFSALGAGYKATGDAGVFWSAHADWLAISTSKALLVKILHRCQGRDSTPPSGLDPHSDLIDDTWFDGSRTSWLFGRLGELTASAGGSERELSALGLLQALSETITRADSTTRISRGGTTSETVLEWR